MENIDLLISESEINNRVNELAKQINSDYKGKELFVICTLKGAVLFTCDLIKKIDIPVMLDFMIASSYNDKTESSGIVKIIKDLDYSIKDKDVLVIDDIVDTGNTLAHLIKILKTRNPNSIEICTLLDKPDRRLVDVNVKYSGFKIEDEFVIGYGLDYDQKYRNLPYVGKVKKRIK